MPSPSKGKGIASNATRRRRVNLTPRNTPKKAPVYPGHLEKLKRRAENERISRMAARSRSRSRSRSRNNRPAPAASPAPSPSPSPSPSLSHGMPEIGGEKLKTVINYKPEDFDTFYRGLDAAEKERLFNLLLMIRVRGGEGRSRSLSVQEVIGLSEDNSNTFSQGMTENDIKTYNRVFDLVIKIGPQKK